MLEDKILNKIAETTFTLRDMQKRLRVLKIYLIIKLFGTTETPEQEVEAEMPWLNSLGEEFFQQFNKENIYQVFEELEKKLSLISPITIYLAFDPPKEATNSIGIWLRQNTKNHPIFDVRVDPNLIGGSAVSKNGQYKDYSLRSRFAQNNPRITEIIKSSLSQKK
jgi:hypothetical protein